MWIPFHDTLVRLSLLFNGGELRLCNLSKIIRTTLEITHLTSVFRIFDDRQGAMAN